MKTLFNIKNKKILINGGSRGIGLTLFKELGKYSGKVFSISRTLGDDIKKFKCDSSDYENTKKVFKKIYKKYGNIDCIINVAAITNKKYDKNIDIESFNAIMNNNIKSYYNTMILCDKFMNNHGSIINITSIAAHTGLRNSYAYSASKGGIKQMSKSMSIDFYKKKKIRINNIAPGYFKTSMTKHSYSNKVRSNQIIERSIMKKWGDPIDLVGPVIFLCSDASKFITGIDLIVDGGFLNKGL